MAVRGGQATYLWKSGNFPILGRAGFPEKQEQVTCQSKFTTFFDQN
jgi:hypothetical protein